MGIKKEDRTQRQLNFYLLPHISIYMITVQCQFFKSLTQNIYNKFIDRLNIVTIRCPSCGHVGFLVFYGTYPRKVINPDSTDQIYIQRVKCNHCSHTHAIFPQCVVPYSSVLLNDQVSIIQLYEEEHDQSLLEDSFIHIDSYHIHRVITNYLDKWKERMKSEDMSFDMSISQLVSFAFDHFRLQFLQIHKGANFLFIPST